MKARLHWYAWGLLALALGMLSAFPIRTGKIRLVLAALVVLVWGGLIALLWLKRKGVGAALLAATLSLLLFLSLAGRPIDPSALRRVYLERLQSYVGATYIWGGENFLGIDCSGLVRRALIDALFLQGWRTANPQAIRDAIALWWHDESALEMGRAADGRRNGGWRGRRRCRLEDGAISGRGRRERVWAMRKASRDCRGW